MLRTSKSGRAAYQSPRPRPIQGEQGGKVPLKAQTAREPTLPSRAPTTLLKAEAKGRHASHRPGEEGTRPGQARDLVASNQPGRCSFFLSQMITNYYKQSLFPNRLDCIWPMPEDSDGMILLGMLRGLSSSDCIQAIGAESALNGRETPLQVRRSSGVGRPLGNNRWQVSLLLGKRFVSNAYRLPIACVVVRDYSSAAPVRLRYGRN